MITLYLGMMRDTDTVTIEYDGLTHAYLTL